MFFQDFSCINPFIMVPVLNLHYHSANHYLDQVVLKWKYLSQSFLTHLGCLILSTIQFAF